MRGPFGAAGLLVVGVALSAFPVFAAEPGAAESDAAEQSAEGDGFQVQSRRPEDYYGTREEIESNLTDDLAAKLRQFDEWTLDGEEQAAAEAAQQAAAAAAAAAGGGAQGAGGGVDGSVAAGDPYSGSHSASADPYDPDDPYDSHDPYDPNANDGAAGVTGADARPGAWQRPTLPVRPDRRAKEDDVARMIREAAEQETDPARRRELLDQYEAYVDGI